MPINRLVNTKNNFSHLSSGEGAYKANSYNCSNATSKVVSLNGTWKTDSISFTVDPLYRYTVHVRNSASFGTTTINIDYIQVYGEASASYLTCIEDSMGYRYGFNGQEKDNEITGVEGSHNTAEFWMYDTRLGRRWNVDPVDQIYISNYACLGNNPIINIDPNGDTFIIEKTQDAHKDIASTVKLKNRKFIKINNDGELNLDFKSKSKKEISRILSKDEGLSLLYDLENAKDIETGRNLLFYYGTSGETNVIPESNNESVFDYYKVVGANLKLADGNQSGSIIPIYDARTAVINASITPYGNNDIGLPGIGFKPNDGYDGKTFVANGYYYKNLRNDSRQNLYGYYIPMKISKKDVIIHELKEVYLRTAYKKSYEEAHKEAGGIGGDEILFTKYKLDLQSLWNGR